MRSLMAVLFVTAAGSLSVGACSSDGDDSAGAAGTGDSSMCHGDYAALTHSEFNAQLDSAGKCANSKDSAIECANDVTTLAEQCGGDCFKNEAPDDKTQDACVTDCLSTSTTSPLSDACTACYIADIGCARDHCLLKCGVEPTSEKCYECRVANGCVAAFFPCSGLPNERALPGTGAAGASGVGTGGAAGAGDQAATAGATGT